MLAVQLRPGASVTPVQSWVRPAKSVGLVPPTATGLLTLSAVPTTICVYVGSRPGTRPEYAAAVRELGAEVGRRGLRLVYGGGREGLMGVLADAALGADAEVVGVIPQRLVDRERAHRGISDLLIVDTLHERKAAMAERADAFLAAPGGIGTLEELIEMLSWSQLRLHDKPCGLLSVEGYFDLLVAWLNHAVAEGFVPEADRSLLRVEASPAALLDSLNS
jgi:uncharacterized protein (TIGR00730 family)